MGSIASLRRSGEERTRMRERPPNPGFALGVYVFLWAASSETWNRATAAALMASGVASHAPMMFLNRGSAGMFASEVLGLPLGSSGGPP